jgi:hypothetical protein
MERFKKSSYPGVDSIRNVLGPALLRKYNNFFYFIFPTFNSYEKFSTDPIIRKVKVISSYNSRMRLDASPEYVNKKK